MKYVTLAALLLGLAATSAHANFTMLEKDDWKIDIGGFAEIDSIYDTRKSFTEVVGNNPVGRPNDEKGRSMFSVRNSRLAFSVASPMVEGWKTRGYLEMDFLGFDPAPGQFSGVSVNEGGFFTSPTMRMRHGYLNAEKNGWLILAGQTWAMFGWQPYYFVPTMQVSPIPAMLYSRTSQVRVMKSFDMGEETLLQVAAGAMRPTQRDGQYPGGEGGLRLVFNGRKGSFTGGATGTNKPQAMSFGVSGTFRNLEIPANPSTSALDARGKLAGAIAVNAMIPVIAAEGGTDSKNNLVIGGEFTTGSGYGDHFSGWTGNQNNPLSSAAANPDKNVNLDAGIGGFDSSGTFKLIKLQTFNVYAQYHLPTLTPTWFSIGFTRLHSINMSEIVIANGTGSTAKTAYDTTQSYFANLQRDLTDQIRVGFEYARLTTTYVDGVKAPNNRFQASAWYMF